VTAATFLPALHPRDRTAGPAPIQPRIGGRVATSVRIVRDRTEAGRGRAGKRAALRRVS
jgi:hypothetical protein